MYVGGGDDLTGDVAVSGVA